MINSERCQCVSKNNKALVKEVITYIKNLFNVDEEEIYLKTKYYIKELLFEVRKNNNEVAVLRKQAREKEEDLNFLEKTDLKGCSYDGVVAGKNTGLKPNNVELRYMKVLELKEEIRNAIQEIWLIEKSLDDKNKLIRSFINLIPQKQYIAVMEFTYFQCITANEISLELNYSSDYVRQAKLRCYSALSEILKCQLKN